MPDLTRALRLSLLAAFMVIAIGACQSQDAALVQDEPARDGRIFDHIHGVSYGPFRDGQQPNQDPRPTVPQLREDLEIMARHWDMIRLYGTGEIARDILLGIREMDLDMDVMLGAWIDSEAEYEDDRFVRALPDKIAENREQVDDLIRLANEFPDVVTALNVGNETQIWWSAHRISTDRLIEYIREVRAKTEQPITTADDFAYWTEPESKRLADELDFIVTHIYAMWHGQQLDEAMAFTQEKLDAVEAAHPGKPIVIGEAGWATRMHNEGLQAELIKGAAGEAEQVIFTRRFVAWAEREDQPYFFFEAFDENWKGGDHPNEVEKHWGVYNEDRTPKPAVSALPTR